MSLDPSHIDLLLQYALLVAGEEDDVFDRQLGPIHLIKYVYLGDLAYAQRHSGQTFTGLKWQFHKFGPWSQTVNERISPALGAIGADCKTFASEFEERDEWFRWSMRHRDLLSDVERQVPPEIRIYLQPVIHRYGKDTCALLDYVYKTAPMLTAAPSEFLDFSPAAPIQARNIDTTRSDPSGESVSEKCKKKFGERLRRLQEKSEDRLKRKPALVNPVTKPPSEAVFREGMAWLDSLAGEELKPDNFVAEFSDSVWKSATRKGGDVS